MTELSSINLHIMVHVFLTEKYHTNPALILTTIFFYKCSQAVQRDILRNCIHISGLESLENNILLHTLISIK